MGLLWLAVGTSLALMITARDGSAAQRETNLPLKSILMPCCVVQSMDPGGRLVLKNPGTGAVLRVKTPIARYHVGQSVDLDAQSTLMALTPFPVKYQKSSKMNQSDAWKLRTSVTVSAEGRLEGTTLIESTDALRGFTGGVEVLLVDRSANILHHSVLRTYGVQPNSSRTNNWHETAPVNAVNKVRGVVIHHSHEPKTRLAASLAWIRANSKDVFLVLTCTPLENDDKDARAGLRPTSGSQQGSSTIQCS